MLFKDVVMVNLVLIWFLLCITMAVWPVLPLRFLYAEDNIGAYLSVVWSYLLMIFSGQTYLRLDEYTDSDLGEVSAPDFSVFQVM